MRTILTVVLSLAALGVSSAGHAQRADAPGDDVLASLPLRGDGPFASAGAADHLAGERRESPPFLKLEQKDDVWQRAVLLLGVAAIQARVPRTSNSVGMTSPTLALQDPLDSSRRAEIGPGLGGPILTVPREPR